MHAASLATINDDALIRIFACMEPQQILSMGKTCKRMFDLSKQRIVWMNACTYCVLQRGYPFPGVSPDTMSASELEYWTCHGFRLACRWISGYCVPRGRTILDSKSYTSVSEVRFVPGHAGKWLLAMSKSIWSVVTLWDITGTPRKVCGWSLRGALILDGFCLNTDVGTETMFAISAIKAEEQTLYILSVDTDDHGDTAFKTVFSTNSKLRPIALCGDVVAIATDFGNVTILNWRQGTSAILEYPHDELEPWQDHCKQVLFTHKSILVIRSRSVHLFPEVTLRQDTAEPLHYGILARHSFGWIDSISVVPSLNGALPYQSLSILIRAESDDPWNTIEHTLDLYTLHPNPAFGLGLHGPPGPDASTPPDSPYIFPPVRTTQVQSLRGPLRCSDIILGPYGTAVWIQPHDRAATGLFWSDDDVPAPGQSPDAHESLVAAVFPGSLASSALASRVVPTSTDGDEGDGCLSAVPQRKILYTNSLNNWTSLDYDEVLGRIALGATSGKLMILEL